MSAYRHKARTSTEVINGKVYNFDSQNEAKLAHWFEANGFAGRWDRNVGATVGGSYYTCDFELAVLDPATSQTRRAIVEAKPNRAALTPNIISRMAGVASYYKTDLLLLYTRQGNAWYRIDPLAGTVTPAAPPTPSTLPLNKLPKSLSLTAEKRGGKLYQRKFNPLGWLADLVIGLLQGPKPKRRYHRRR